MTCLNPCVPVIRISISAVRLPSPYPNESMRPLCLLILAVTSLQTGAAGQTSGSLGESYARARQLLDRSIETHGGVAALRAARRIHVRIEGHDVWRNQSRKVAPPYDREPMSADIRLDSDANRMIYHTRSAYPGGFGVVLRDIIDGQEGIFISFGEGTHTRQPARTVAEQQHVLFQLPHLVLLDMLDNAAGLRWLGPITLASGARVEAIATSSSQGLLTVGIDPSNAELRALLSMRADAVVGDAVEEVEWTGYARQGAILMPARRVERVAGQVTGEARFVSIEFAPEFPDSLQQPRPGSIEQAAPGSRAPEVRELGAGAWAIRERGSWILAVAFSDHVLVMETPWGLREAIGRIATLAPGKPIRYAVPTHHHDDHAGSVRYAVNAGATIVTTPGNRAVMTRMATARSTLVTGDDTLRVREPTVETISGRKRVFSDGTRTVEIHDIGPSPHAEEMLVAWLPAEGVVFQGDLLNLPPSGEVTRSAGNPTTAHFAAWLRRQGWSVKTIAGVHMAPQPIAVLDQALQAYAGPR
jgi:glyoxylase-like metal-dependent hydrolase (beta-lactamase superfamily II)